MSIIGTAAVRGSVGRGCGCFGRAAAIWSLNPRDIQFDEWVPSPAGPAASPPDAPPEAPVLVRPSVPCLYNVVKRGAVPKEARAGPAKHRRWTHGAAEQGDERGRLARSIRPGQPLIMYDVWVARTVRTAAMARKS